MRTFVIRARSVSTRSLYDAIGGKGHLEVVLHTVMNAFFISNAFRDDVEVYIVFDSTLDFPRTIQLSGGQGLSFQGFHEQAIFSVIENAFQNSADLKKNQSLEIAPGVKIHGYGFEKCAGYLLETRPVYLLDRKGEDIRSIQLSPDPVFVLSDHLPMPKNSVKGLIRKGMKILGLGKKMLFASQCVVLIHDEMDRLQEL